jgi:SAM-dependent MidA family methyltransferase
MQVTKISPSLEPNSIAAQRSQQLQQRIKNEIQIDGAISFAHFMALALYAPDLGYYTASLPKLGQAGDFITAPEVSSAFSKCLARQCAQILEKTSGNILEIGAGSGRMALDLLKELDKLQALPDHYYILEVSPDFRQRQQQLLTVALPHFKDRLIWLEALPVYPFGGLILANEVMDAFPVHRFRYSGNSFQEFYVEVAGDTFSWRLDTPQRHVLNYLQGLPISFSEGYESECHLSISNWMKSLSSILDHGVILLLDYGFPRHEYYHPDRHTGTLMCHYHHQAHADPLVLVGLQDITSHIDFTQVAQLGVGCGLDLAGYTNQASFLLSCGIIDYLREERLPENYYQLANEIKVLTSPNEMGELFKVMAFTKNISTPLLGFSMRNLSERL